MSGNVKEEAVDYDDFVVRIVQLMQDIPSGINDKVLMNSIPELDTKGRATCINKLLATGKIDLFKAPEGLLYKLKAPSNAINIRGDQEEKVVFKIIETSGNKGIWLRDIRAQSGLLQQQLNKVLKSLEAKKLVKSVKSVNANKKKVYMLYDLEPDNSVTGGTWYSDQDFESEFVEILNQQCHRFLLHREEKASANKSGGPLAVRNGSLVKVSEIASYISELGISKVTLRHEDIDAIMKTLIYDGKAERMSGDGGEAMYRAVKSLVDTPGLVKSPCGVCPVIKDCGERGVITPATCQYLQEWLDF
eukprot:TRINITY_DN5271_c0_g1_i12.p1 TRINITY_DN5271_c0_g1~~TRINITY_DN5271_c0_g1_i12.p1  ORF type:complete len:304 (-),score=62.55 TRINITY_DN5271_c0_g1_i12:266-1177(-)